MKTKLKKGVMSEVIALFIMVLIISILVGMTFLFIGTLKDQVEATDLKSGSDNIVNESVSLSATTDFLVYGLKLNPNCTTSLVVKNVSTGDVVNPGNYTLSGTGCGFTFNASAGHPNEYNNTLTGATVLVDYNATFDYYGEAYKAVNETEIAGATIIDYLPLLFLAIIFGVILAVVLKIILPYINLGQQVGGF